MGTIQNGSFYSSYLGDQIDLLLAAMAQANPLPSGTDWVAFIDDCRAAQNGAEAAAELAEAAQSGVETAQNGAEAAAQNAAASAEAILNMTVSAHAVTGEPTVTKTQESGVFNLDFGIPSGGGGGLPSGGTAGQYLVKQSSATGDAAWEDLPLYEGSYEVTPLVGADTVMQTQGTYLDRNVVLKAIPYTETTNLSGGKTATIGG